MTMAAPLLELHGVVAGYGPVTVLNGLSWQVAAGGYERLYQESL